MKYLKLLFISTLLTCFVPKNTFGQNANKKVKYADAKGVYISEKRFNECLKAGYPTTTIEEDRIIVHFLSRNYFEGKLTQTENEQVRLMVEKIVGKDIDSNKTIAIHLYKKNDKQLQRDIKYKRYWKWIKKNPNRIEAFLIGNKDSGIIPNPEKHVYVDSYNFLNNTFFNNSELDYNHLAFKPDGTYRLFLGEYDILGVIDGTF
ncbi:hypothetical protein [Xanthomarina sp. F2636L]|uniref:hypothetical protein n=1 Tax=Xanthomarina sp. F2636L TaxID=2996018 RepID=UPI00225DDDCF|nr:hypothetical protein [Xanthomarina sp. F2636L]MCX7549435.1 hypothetical protein [Xanthomarina sp. F2636L]